MAATDIHFNKQAISRNGNNKIEVGNHTSSFLHDKN